MGPSLTPALLPHTHRQEEAAPQAPLPHLAWIPPASKHRASYHVWSTVLETGNRAELPPNGGGWPWMDGNTACLVTIQSQEKSHR